MPKTSSDHHRSKEFFDILIDNSLQGLAIIQDRKLIYANRTLSDMTGYTQEELFTLSINGLMSLVYPEDQNRIIETLLYGLAQKQFPLRREFRIIRKDGAILWVYAFASFIEYEGKPAINIAFLDVSEQKHAKEEAILAKEQYIQILESISDGFFAFDDNFIVTYFNKAAELLLGRKASEVTGHNLFEAFPEGRGSLFEEQYTLALKEKVATSFETYFGVKPYENWYDVRVYPKENGVSVFFQVITERKTKEEELKRSEKRFHNLFETMEHGVVYQDREGRIIACNPSAERLLGLTCEQMDGRTSSDPRWKAICEDGSDFPGDTHPAMIALATGKEVKNAVMGVFNPQENKYKWIRINAVPQFRQGEIEPYQVYTNFEDITERRKLERDLQDREELFHGIFELSPVGIQLFDAEGRLIHANKASMDIMGWKDLTGARTYNIFQDMLNEDELRNELLKGKTLREGKWIKIKSGKQEKSGIPIGSNGLIHIDYIFRPIGETGHPKNYLVIMQENTEQTLANDALIGSNERLQIIYELWRTRVKTSNLMRLTEQDLDKSKK